MWQLVCVQFHLYRIYPVIILLFFSNYIYWQSDIICMFYVSMNNCAIFFIKLSLFKEIPTFCRQVYNIQHLQFTCFVHCLSIIARLLMYSCGRQLFPVKSPDGEILYVQDMLVSWIKVRILTKFSEFIKRIPFYIFIGTLLLFITFFVRQILTFVKILKH